MQDILTGFESNEQRVECRLLVILGEWFLDLDDGVPWFQPDGSGTRPIMGGRANMPYAEAVMKRRVMGTDGIEEILRFDMRLDASTRALTATVTVRDTDGNVITVSISAPF